MSTGKSSHRCLIALAGASVLFVACQPPAAEPSEAYPVDMLPTIVDVEGYPVPIPTSKPVQYPTNAVTGETMDQRSYFASPSPDEAVEARIVAIDDYSSQLRFEITAKVSSDAIDSVQEIYVTTPGALWPIRVGDEHNPVRITGLSEPYLTWVQYCNTPCLKYEQGLHATRFPDGQDYLVSSDPNGAGTSMVSWPWVAYLIGNSSYAANLVVVNLETRETRTISQSVPIDTNGRYYYAVNDGQIAWVETDGNSYSWTLSVMDLASGKAMRIPDRALDIRGISVSVELVTWWSDHWRGFDREAAQSFTVPILGDSSPDDWETIQELETPSVHGRTVTWAIALNSDSKRYTAEVRNVDR